MHELTIYRRYFFRSACYQAGRGITPTGVQVHSTGANNPWLRRYVAPDDGRIGKNAYDNDHNRDGNVCAHAYIGKQADGTVAVYQTLPWTMQCRLSGSGTNGSANQMGYIGFEVCEDDLTDSAYFHSAVLTMAAKLTAYLCAVFSLDPAEAVRDHAELYRMGLASDHADITRWLEKHHWNMEEFRRLVRQYTDEGVHGTYIECDEESVMYQAKVISEKYLNLRAGKGKTCASLARLSNGTAVDVINDSDPEWWYVRCAGITGYVMRMYLEMMPDDPSVTRVDASPDKGGCLTLESLTAIKALLVPLLQEVETAIQTLK